MSGVTKKHRVCEAINTFGIMKDLGDVGSLSEVLKAGTMDEAQMKVHVREVAYIQECKDQQSGLSYEATDIGSRL